MIIIVNITAKCGIFNWLANELLKLTKGNPKLVLLTLGLFTAIASAFLDNVTTVIIINAGNVYHRKGLELNPIPLLITEILTSNIGGTATLIGDPPNIIIGSAAGLSFSDFLFELAGIITLILFVSIGILMLMFKNQLKLNLKKQIISRILITQKQ